MPHAPCLRELLEPPLKLISKLSSPLKLVSKLKKKEDKGTRKQRMSTQWNYKDDSEEKPMIMVHAAGLKSNESRLELKS